MSTNIENTSFSLREILTSLADSLNDAQQELRNVEPFDEYGRPNTVYHLPYLDFNLQVVSEFEQTSEAIDSPTAKDKLKSYLKFKSPKAPESKTNKNTQQIISTISGRFIATMPTEGTPQIIINTQVDKLSLNGEVYVTKLKVLLSNAAGEVLAGNKIELNYLSEMSDAISEREAKSLPGISSGELLTNANGEADFEISLPKVDYNASHSFFFRINAATITKTISIQK